ncbi:MAG: HepT-like ribonuclease domain-containing protein [Thermodesulfobacteriota bacterium]
MIDKKAVKDAKKVLKDHLEKLHLLRDQGYEEFTSDFRNIDSSLLRLQQTVKAFLALEMQIAALLSIEALPPDDEYFNHLKEGGHLPKERRKTYEAMIVFREKIGKLAERMDKKVLYAIVTNELDDIEHFEKNLLSIIKAHKKG